jgi:hypothetical protein
MLCFTTVQLDRWRPRLYTNSTKACHRTN